MTKNFKRIMIAATIAFNAVQTLPVSACGGSGGASRGGFRGGISTGFGGGSGFGGGGVRGIVGALIARPSVYHQPAYSQPAYSQPTYSQPAYSQPVYAQPTSSQPTYSQTAPSQAPAPVQQIASTIPQPQSAVSPSTARAAVPAPIRTAATENPPAQSALQMLASMTTDSPAPTDAVSAASSIPEFTSASPSVASANVGTWKVSLPGNQSVELVLQDDGQFSWTATKSGATSQFAGTYQIAGTQLTLVRANDQQQMRGNWTASENGFTFKLDGATTGGLAFTR